MDITALPASPLPGAAAAATPSALPAHANGAGGFARSLEQAASRQMPDAAAHPQARPLPVAGAQMPSVPAVAAQAPGLTGLSLARLTTAADGQEAATPQADELPEETPADLAAMLLQAPLLPTAPAAGAAAPGLPEARPPEAGVPDELQRIRSRLQAIESAGQLPFPGAAEAALAGQPAQVAPSPLPTTASSTAVPAATAAPANAGQSPFQQTTSAGVEQNEPAQPAPPVAPGESELPRSERSSPALPLAEGARTGEGLPPGLETTPGSNAAFPLASGSLSAGGLATAGNPASASLTAPLASPEWQRGLSQHLIGLQQRGEQEIELHLHPAELGPLSISLKLGEAGAQAQFLSTHPQVRAAVEQAIPQLREALAEQGITLGEASVGERQQQPQGERSGSSGHGRALASGIGEEPASGAVEAVAPTPVRLGGVDLYA